MSDDADLTVLDGGRSPALLAPVNENTKARAIKEYGEKITDPSLLVFAKLVAEGHPKRRAFEAIRPGCSLKVAETQAAILCQHPAIRKAVYVGALGSPQEVMKSLTPAALDTLLDLLANADDKTRGRMVDSLLDRSGVPRVKESRVSGIQVSMQMIAGLTPPPDDDPIDGETVEDADPIATLEQEKAEALAWLEPTSARQKRAEAPTRPEDQDDALKGL